MKFAMDLVTNLYVCSESHQSGQALDGTGTNLFPFILSFIIINVKLSVQYTSLKQLAHIRSKT